MTICTPAKERGVVSEGLAEPACTWLIAWGIIRYDVDDVVLGLHRARYRVRLNPGSKHSPWAKYQRGKEEDTGDDGELGDVSFQSVASR